MGRGCNGSLVSWKVLVDNLLTHDHIIFKEGGGGGGGAEYMRMCSYTSALYLPSGCMHSFGQRSFSYAAPSSGTVSFAKLGHQTHSHLSNHLQNIATSS